MSTPQPQPDQGIAQLFNAVPQQHHPLLFDYINQMQQGILSIQEFYGRVQQLIQMQTIGASLDSLASLAVKRPFENVGYGSPSPMVAQQ